jgi:hypothetical protein
MDFIIFELSNVIYLLNNNYSTPCAICGRKSATWKAVIGHMMGVHPKQRVFSVYLTRQMI